MTPKGLFCPAGGFHVDPSRAVELALITHAHSDHARRGARRYITARSGEGVLRERLGEKIDVSPVAFGERIQLGETVVSFHPAGHILGSAQVRIEKDGEVWVVSGDYKRDADPTCEPFEVVPCDVFITEATFGMPTYRWESPSAIGREIYEWWMKNAARGDNSLLFAYSLGKTQRVLAELAELADRPVLVHRTSLGINERYRREGVKLAPTRALPEIGSEEKLLGELVLAPPQSFGTKELLRFGRFRTAFASGWMQGSNLRRYDRGFPLSDHADWPSLLRTIEETGARRIYVAHREDDVLIRHLRSRGLEAHHVSTLGNEAPMQMDLRPLEPSAPAPLLDQPQ